MEKFKDRLEELRKGKTQKEFAELIGFPKNTYTNWARGIRQPSAENIAQICTRLGVSADWLLGLDSGDSSGGCAGCRERDAALAALSDTVRHLTEALRRGKGA